MGKIHDSHLEHKLELKNYQKPYKCDGCKEQGFGSRYRCEICDYDLHEDCMFTSPTASHDFFKNCTFKFFNQRKCTCKDCLRYCDACGKPVYGFVYHCEDKGWDLHPCCLNLKEIINLDGLQFQLRKDKVSSSKCIWCNKRKLKDCHETKIPGWSYVSTCKSYHFHVYCATEMLLEGWKNGGQKKGLDLDLKKLELPVLALNRRRGRGGGKYLRIVKLFFKAIACILLGDPTITLTCLLVDVLT